MEKIKKNKRLIIIILVVVLIISIAGGTLAYLGWRSSDAQKTEIAVTIERDFMCSIDGGGPIEDSQYQLIPTDCMNPDYAIQREVKVMPTLYKENYGILFDMWIDVKNLTSGLSGSKNFKYALTTSSTSCTEGVISSGTFQGLTNNGRTENIFSKAYENTTEDTYYLYIWLDKAQTSTETTDQQFSLSLNGTCTNDEGIVIQQSVTPVPVLDDGMIPVTISNNGVATVADTSSEWYNYSNKEWANVVLVKENATTGTTGSYSREYYKNNPGTTVLESDILAYYVWIPRYKYKIWTLSNSATGKEQTIDIVFEATNAQVTQGAAVGDYITHPAFVWDGTPIAGFWVGKFETSHSPLASSTTLNNLGCTDENCANADGLIIKPNVKSLRYNKISYQFYATRSMTRSSNPFGLSSSQTDSHMMKNSEWGAVAYLSHSQYGINQEIYINNSSGYYTGRSGGNVGGSQNSLATQFPDSSTSTTKYNSYGYYTWTGQAISSSGTIGSYASDRTLGTNASTTGNVTGVYDMSGGAWEYVMGYYSGANSNYATDTSYFGWTSSANNAGFTADILSKYWDNYTKTSNTTACNSGVCLGHALSETYYWYGDYRYFVYATSPWFSRGGSYDNGAGAGAWNFNGLNGSAFGYYSFRSVAIVGA